MPYLCKSLLPLLLMTFGGTVFAQGQTYPTRPVTVVVALTPGGSIEQEARVHAKKMTEVIGQPFLLDFKPGAGGAVGAGYVAKAAPDGYTLLVVSATFTVFPTFHKDLSFDTINDFAPISQMSDKVNVLFVRPSFPPKTFAEYISYAKASPGKINFGTTGIGSVSHLAGGWIHSATNTQATFVAYKGGDPMMQDLLGGRLDVVSLALLNALPLIKAGKVRVLGVMGSKRSTLLPGVPTIAEQGIPDYNYSSWLGFSAPSGTSGAIVKRLNEGFVKVINAPDVLAFLSAQGSVPVGSSPAQFKQLIAAETTRWQKVAKDADIRELE